VDADERTHLRFSQHERNGQRPYVPISFATVRSFAGVLYCGMPDFILQAACIRLWLFCPTYLTLFLASAISPTVDLPFCLPAPC